MALSLRARYFWPAALATLALDQVTKRFAVYFLTPPYVPREVVGDLLRFTLAYNPGAAFGIPLDGVARPLLAVLSSMAILL
ncbi:MAG: signal peptidase II, partial [Gemmatimonadota bacterium]|nr:signal peptidase II [Gemmatimonadota bacterium]